MRKLPTRKFQKIWTIWWLSEDYTEQANTGKTSCRQKTNEYGTRNHYNQWKRSGRHAERSRLDDTAGNVRPVYGILLWHPQAIRDIYKNHELLEETTICYIRQEDGTRYEVYSLEMVIALAFRLRSRECMAFRMFIMERLYAPNREKPIHLFFSLSEANPRYKC